MNRSVGNPLPALLIGAGNSFKEIVLAAAPQGLQGRARRNAWMAVSDDAVRARAREEAAHAMGLALVGPLLGQAAGT